MARMLVIDKSCFQGTRSSSLIEFMREYRVFLPHVLAIECLTSDERNGKRPAKNPIHLLRRVEAAVKAGACFGRSSVSMYREEKESRCAVVQIIDKKTTQAMRTTVSVLTEDFVRGEAEECEKTFAFLIKPVSGLGRALVATIKKKAMSAGFQQEIRETSEVERFGKWLEAAERNKVEILQKWVPGLASVMTEEWYTWQLIRLWYGWAIEWASKRADLDDTALPSNISNDFYDLEYVASLSRADGLLTGDRRLVEPLARAAFPEKEVFSSLEEVPESYRCDWGQG